MEPPCFFMSLLFELVHMDFIIKFVLEKAGTFIRKISVNVSNSVNIIFEFQYGHCILNLIISN